jgi:hypothetical protein
MHWIFLDLLTPQVLQLSHEIRAGSNRRLTGALAWLFGPQWTVPGVDGGPRHPAFAVALSGAWSKRLLGEALDFGAPKP